MALLRYKQLAICLLLLLSACTKNEFKLRVDFGDAKITESINAVYYSSDSKKGWITEQSIPVVEGVAEAVGITRNPSVVYLYASDSSLKVVFYAERGDEIKIDASGGTWMVSGNDINEEWSAWRKKNEATLNRYDAKAKNALVKKYVKAHPDSPVSLLILCTTYSAVEDPEEYEKLWDTLTDEAKDSKILAALGKSPDTLGFVGKRQKIGALKLYALGDTLIKVNPAKSSKTIFLFWGSTDGRMGIVADIKRMLKAKEIKGDSIAVVDVNMQVDTLGWRSTIERDSVEGWVHAWAPGGEQNNVLLPFRLSQDPYVVVVDSVGKQIYRGKKMQKL